MKRSIFIMVVMALLFAIPAHAHFGMVIPSADIIEQGDKATVKVDLMFAHPFEMEGMDLVKPLKAGVVCDGKTNDLLGELKPVSPMGTKAWSLDYKIKRPGVYTFYMEPKPYWEPAEDCYIVHYTKVITSAFGLEDGWDEEIGLKTEIVPLTRPFGNYAGNVFQGIVKVDGKKVPFAEVEVEYYNQDKKCSAPKESMITQVVKADENGVFTYAVPRAGWWGFAALNTADEQIKGKDIEIGAVLWTRFYEMK